MKTLIISSCTKDKIYDIDNQLTKRDFSERTQLADREESLAQYKTKARDIYKGRQHARLIEGIDHLRNKFGNDVIDLAIISAGYGLLHENDEIVPYNVTFSEMKKDEVVEWARYLQINERTSEFIQSYDLVIFLLGEEYLRSLCLPFVKTKPGQKLVFLTSKASKKMIPPYPPYYFVEVRHQDAKEFGEMSISIKGYLFKLLAQEAVLEGLSVFDQVYNDPNTLLIILEHYRKPTIEQLNLFEDGEGVRVVKKSQDIKKQKEQEVLISLAHIQPARNYGFHEMKYYMPENNDRVDPSFNFITEEHKKDRDPFIDDVYAHELYKKANYDGILVSKANIEESETRKQRIIEMGGLRNFLRLPANIPLYGDCGAFSYIAHEKPPYTTEEILHYYDDFQFNIGVSIDHLIIGKIAEDIKKRDYRFDLTLENAKDFLVKHQQGGFRFKPSGIAQGWNPASYREAVKQLVDMGYQHISLGGLAFAKSEEILAVLMEVAPLLPEYMEVHLFGAARLESVAMYHKLGVTSFDSTTFLKKAWGSASGGNYFTKDHDKFAAIRIPQANFSKNTKLKEIVERGIHDLPAFQEMEQQALAKLRDYSDGIGQAQEVMETVLGYDSYFETLKEYRTIRKAQLEKRNEYIAEHLTLEITDLQHIAKEVAETTKLKSAVTVAETIAEKAVSWKMEKMFAWVEEQMYKQLRAIHKKTPLLYFKEYEQDDMTFSQFFTHNVQMLAGLISNHFFQVMHDISVLEMRAIQEKGFTIFNLTLKEYFAEHYERVLEHNKLRPHYEKVLAAQPWKKCGCDICKQVGVEVIIFRGNNRNRRRGFHNTHVFYEQFKELMQKQQVGTVQNIKA